MSDPVQPVRLGQVEFLGAARVPEEPVLLLPSWIDFELLQQIRALLQGRSLVYLVPDGAAFDPLIAELVMAGEAIPFIREDPASAATAKLVKAAVAEGKTVLFVPEPALGLSGAVSKVPAVQIHALAAMEVPLLPLYANSMGAGRLAVEKDIGEAAIGARFGDLIPAGEATLPRVQAAFFDGSEETFSRRSILDVNLGRLLIRGLKRVGANARIIDGLDGSELGYDKVLAAGLALADFIRKDTKKDRVGIVLPPGKGGLIANLAVVLAGKTPVNLNFTAGRDAIESAISRSDMDRYITADPFVRKQSTFPWPPNRELILLERLLPKLKVQCIKWAILSKILPASMLARKIGLPSKGGEREASLLFTSGSSGEPKGVVLTHRNFVANVVQFSTRLDMDADDKVVGCLPLFHSFGCTVTLWYPMIEGLSLVTYPSPLEPPKIAELIETHRASLLLGTATFLRGYLRRVKAEQLAPLKYVVAGAEKLPTRLAEAFEKKFNKRIMEGYGLTETSPVSNFNVPDVVPSSTDPDDIPVIPSYRPGAVGHFVTGMSVRIRNAETGENQPLNEAGVISLRGANVFTGYLNDRKRTKEVLEDGWFATGDMGRIDEDGILHIEGRLSRFSKIAGEMVPHETVEDYITKAMGIDSDDERKVAVVGLPDESKGELLYLISTVATETLNQELIDLRYTLLDLGMPSLWVPKQIIPVEEIPILASGKLDIQGCERLAKVGLGIGSE